MALTRAEMVDIIDAGGVVLFNGIRYSNSADLPTQEEIDAINQGGGGATIIFPDAIDVGNFPDYIGQLDKDADGGIKVHVQNPSGGGSGGGGLTDAELRATPVDVDVTFPAVQPVSDNGGSLTVDGSVAVSNFPATQPVSGTVDVGNFPATQVTSNATIGATTDAEATGDGTLVGLLKRARTLLGDISTLITNRLPASLGSGGGVKVDVQSGAGGVSFPSSVVAFSSASRSAGAYYTSTITNTGYKGIIVYIRVSAASSANINVAIQEYNEASGDYAGVLEYQGLLVTATITTTGYYRLQIYPAIAVTANQTLSQHLPARFRIAFAQNAGTSTAIVAYQLLP